MQELLDAGQRRADQDMSRGLRPRAADRTGSPAAKRPAAQTNLTRDSLAGPSRPAAAAGVARPRPGQRAPGLLAAGNADRRRRSEPTRGASFRGYPAAASQCSWWSPDRMVLPVDGCASPPRYARPCAGSRTPGCRATRSTLGDPRVMEACAKDAAPRTGRHLDHAGDESGPAALGRPLHSFGPGSTASLPGRPVREPRPHVLPASPDVLLAQRRVQRSRWPRPRRVLPGPRRPAHRLPKSGWRRGQYRWLLRGSDGRYSRRSFAYLDAMSHDRNGSCGVTGTDWTSGDPP